MPPGAQVPQSFINRIASHMPEKMAARVGEFSPIDVIKKAYPYMPERLQERVQNRLPGLTMKDGGVVDELDYFRTGEAKRFLYPGTALYGDQIEGLKKYLKSKGLKGKELDYYMTGQAKGLLYPGATLSKGGIAKKGKKTLPKSIYGTDVIPAALTPNEMVLTEKQQKAVAPIPGKEHMLRKDQLKVFKANPAWAKIPRVKYQAGKGRELEFEPANITGVHPSVANKFIWPGSPGNQLGAIEFGGKPSLEIGGNSRGGLSTMPFAGYKFSPTAYPTTFSYVPGSPGGYAARAMPAAWPSGGGWGNWGSGFSVPGGGTFMGGNFGPYVGPSNPWARPFLDKMSSSGGATPVGV